MSKRFWINVRGTNGEIVSMEGGEHETAEHAEREYMLAAAPDATPDMSTTEIWQRYQTWAAENSDSSDMWAEEKAPDDE